MDFISATPAIFKEALAEIKKAETDKSKKVVAETKKGKAKSKRRKVKYPDSEDEESEVDESDDEVSEDKKKKTTSEYNLYINSMFKLYHYLFIEVLRSGKCRAFHHFCL